MKKARIFAVILLSALLFSSIATINYTSANPSLPVLYRNDTKYNLTDYPPEMINGTLHVPLVFFVGLDGIRYVPSVETAGFYIENSNTKRFISFSYNANGILVDNEFTSVIFPASHSTVYMPLEFCAEILGLKIEKKNDGKTERIRILDGSEKLSFDELIRLYENDPSKPPEITPDDPTDPTMRDGRRVYITIDTSPNENTEKILDTLKNSKTRATFFFTESGMLDSPDGVIRAFAEGHEVGIHLTSDDPLAEFERTKRIFRSILNMSPRLVKSDSPFTSPVGVTLISGGIYSGEEGDAKASTLSRTLYNATFSNNTTIISFSSGARSADILNRLLSYVNSDANISAVTLDPTYTVEE